jgi:hypothetical protein
MDFYSFQTNKKKKEGETSNPFVFLFFFITPGLVAIRSRHRAARIPLRGDATRKQTQPVRMV